MDRILEFSKTVGLCNYSTSPRQGVPASPVSCLDSESGVGVVPLLSLKFTRTLKGWIPFNSDMKSPYFPWVDRLRLIRLARNIQRLASATLLKTLVHILLEVH